MIGETIAHYRITEKIGAGGMGEVFRATDAKLGREVALKLLPEAFTSDTQRKGRFQREAQLLASLNHPNIAAIHGVEEDKGRLALVLELVGGEDLSERLARGAVPQEDAVEIARQIAEAVEAAHECGVVHRDLKPGNIKITPAGRVKVLDFGLAKALAGDPSVSGADASMSPTLTAAATQAGVVLGTAAYMSPEQAKGKSVDRRADIWSFGVILFEMVSGRRLFSGETVSETLAAVIKDAPEWSALPGDLPPAVHALLRRCLEKDPRRRLQSAGEARVALEGVQRGDADLSLPGAVAADPGPPSGRVNAAALAGWAALIVMMIAITFIPALRARLGPGPPEPPRRAVFEFRPADLRLGLSYQPVVSPRGDRIAYVDGGAIWIRSMTSREPRKVEGTEGAADVTWSPDGGSLAFTVGARVMKIPASGGSPVQVSTLPQSALDGLAWTDDGWLYSAGGVGPVYRVDARGGEAEEVLPGSGEDRFDFHPPAPVPGGAIVYAVHRVEGVDTIEAFDGRASRVILRIEGATIDMPRYVEGGHLVYHRRDRNDGVWAVPFDPERLNVTGEPFLVVAGGRYPSVSRDGTLVYVDPGDVPPRQLVEVDRQGRVVRELGSPRPGLSSPVVSPDGRRAMVTIDEGDGDQVWLVDLDSEEFTRLTVSDEPHQSGAWLPGGERVALHAGGTGMSRRIAVYGLDGRGEPEAIATGLWPSFTPDGRSAVFTALNPDTAADILVADLDNDGGEARPLISTEKLEGAASLSPDGRFLLYMQGMGNLPAIFLTDYPGAEGVWQLSSDRGFTPFWSHEGDEVFYLEPEKDEARMALMAVKVQTAPEVKVGHAVELFSLTPRGIVSTTYGFWLDAMPGGRTFLAIRRVEEQEGDPAAVVVVQDWLAAREERDRP